MRGGNCLHVRRFTARDRRGHLARTLRSATNRLVRGRQEGAGAGMSARSLGISTLVMMSVARGAAAQDSEPPTRVAATEQAQAEKAQHLTPYVPTTTERLITRVQDILQNQTIRWHP